MKKLFILIQFSLFVIISVTAQQSRKLTIEDAWGIVQKDIITEKDYVNVHVCDTIVKANTLIATAIGSELSPNFDGWFFFIDDKPFESWTHPCRYVFVNIENGAYVQYSKELPPLFERMVPTLEQKVINNKKTLFDFSDSKSRSIVPTATMGQKYAVIISGGYNSYSNWERYWNNCASLYQALVNIYGYSKDHIYVLMSDGTDSGLDRHMKDGSYESSPTDLDGDGVADVQYAATRASLAQVFNSLDSVITAEDNLFVFTTDHGALVNGQTTALCLWNEEILYDYEFASYINQSSARQVLMCLTQCHSGGFIDNITRSNVFISASCSYDENTYATEDLLYSEYVYHWLSAIAGETPNGASVNADSNNDGFLCMKEINDYAKVHVPLETNPQYCSKPSLLGNYTNLTGAYPFDILGSGVLYNTATYSVQNIPTGHTVSWTLSGNNGPNFTVQNNTPSTNQVTINRKEYPVNSWEGYVTLNAHVMYNDSIYASFSKEITTPYIYGLDNPCSTSGYSVDCLPSNCSVSWNLSGIGYSVVTNFVPVPPQFNGFCVQRTSSQDFANGTITANLSNGNTLTKHISSAAGLTGTWYQTSSHFPPYIPDATPSNLECGVMYIVDQNKKIVLQSDDFIDATLTCNNGNVSLMHFQNSNTASFYTNTNNGNTFTVRGYKSGTCIVYKFIFKAIGEPILYLSVNSSGHDYVFSLLEKQAEERSGENLSKSQYSGKWQLTITQYETGQTVYEGNCDSQSITVNTAGWKSGVYVVIAKANDNTITQKISISE